jgi:hypothetical protein
MKKLALDLAGLRIDSFSTSRGAQSARGTVRANSDEFDTQWDCGLVGNNFGNTESQYWKCSPQPTQYDPSCQGTCAGQQTCGVLVCVPF